MLADDASGGHSAGPHRVSGGAGTVQPACRDPLRDASICSMASAPPDQHRIERLIEALETEFPAEPDSARVEIARAPGRVNLIGDHTDYNEGFVLPVAIELDTWIAFRRRQDGHVRVASRQSRETGSFWIDELAPIDGRGLGNGNGSGSDSGRDSGGPHWTDYVAGVAWSLRDAALPVRGFDGVVDSSLPLRSGLSSSAALELVSALALLGGGHVLAAPALAALAQRAERNYVGVDCGIMDHFASAAGREGRALLLDCRSLETRHAALPWEKMPGLFSWRDLDLPSLRRHPPLLPDAPARRAEHVVAENGRVLATV